MGIDRRAQSREASARIAFCGLVAALSVTLMLSGGLIPVATYCSPMAAGVLLLGVLLEFGQRTAWTTYAATAIISLLLGTDKEAAFFYLFMGYYPIVKWSLERIRNRPLRFFTKAAYFSISVILMYLILGYLFNMQAIVEEFSQMGIWLSAAFLVLFVLCMFLYDRLLFPLVLLYVNRLKPKLRFLHR